MSFGSIDQKSDAEDSPLFAEEDEPESKQSVFQKFIKILKNVKNDKWKLLSLLLFNGLYLLVGGLSFYFLEKNTLKASRKIEQVEMLLNFFRVSKSE